MQLSDKTNYNSILSPLILKYTQTHHIHQLMKIICHIKIFLIVATRYLSILKQKFNVLI